MRYQTISLTMIVILLTTSFSIRCASVSVESTEQASGQKPLQAGTGYYVATNGDDGNPGTEAQPFRTVQRAANAAREPGATVFIRSGTYGHFKIRYSGAENQPITFRNYPGERATITGGYSNVVLQHNDGADHAIGWIVIDGLEIIDGGHDGIKGYNTHHLIIRNCDIHHNHSNNILITGSHHVTITGNRFHENSWYNPDSGRHHGHSLYATGNDYTVTNNLFYSGGAYGIQLAAYDQSVHSFIQPGFEHINRWLIANNTFAFFKDRSAIVIWDGYGGDCDDITIVNNIFYRNAESGGPSFPNGIYFYKKDPSAIMENITVHYNVYFGERTFIGNVGNAQYTTSDNIDADPGFIDADGHDFRLGSTSPAIDAGIALDEVPDDFDGTPRTHGAGYDIGAYEYVESPEPTPTVTHTATPEATNTHYLPLILNFSNRRRS